MVLHFLLDHSVREQNDKLLRKRGKVDYQQQLDYKSIIRHLVEATRLKLNKYTIVSQR